MKMKRKKQKFITCIDDRYKYILMNIFAWKLCLKKKNPENYDHFINLNPLTTWNDICTDLW